MSEDDLPRHVPDTDRTERLVTFFKALSDPIRLAILSALTRQYLRKDIGVCALGEELGISQPNVSHHLKILKNAGLVRCEKRENYCFYVLDERNLESIPSLFRSEIFGMDGSPRAQSHAQTANEPVSDAEHTIDKERT